VAEVSVDVLPVEIADSDLLRALLGELPSAFLAGVPLPVLLTYDQSALRRAGLDRRSARRLLAAGRIAKRYGWILANIDQNEAIALSSLAEVLSETGLTVFEELAPSPD
jgi:hypothetical protein